ncbi:extracellular matrix regulator RemB [Acutalibacter sp. JLR.KK004]|uniref:extracellular matrix regulator RemB n=1 Tax=Acutalibacter sp. JLR.KK004 TaxID=3112622 RepID=UPI00216D133C|nr:DUF370 domain-containing protein [Acutalibacter sp.]MCI9115917.1 DUF370 domain-containing protein [Acutalibacter sp.]
MYLHLGQDTVVRTSSIIGVFDLDNTTVSKHTRSFLAKAQQEGRVVNVSAELPKSFILCAEEGVQRVYLSQLAPVTLLKRSRHFLL